MQRIISFTLVFVLGISLGIVLMHERGRSGTPLAAQASAAPETALEHAKKHLDPSYVCPMHPQVVRGEPGKCPICGMSLVLKKAEASDAEEHRAKGNVEGAPAVTVSPAVVSQLGVRTAEVRRGSLARYVEGFGVFLRTTVQGYRPVYRGPSANDAGTSTSAILVQGQVFEREAPLVKTGQSVRVRVPGIGEKEWKGKVIGTEAQVSQTTHTQVFHVSVDPAATTIPPGMTATLTVEVDPVTDVLLVPRQAVIVTGQGARVMIARGGGRFEQRTVEVEDAGEDEIAIRSGLHEGEQVVVSAQFLLDSEANLQAGLQRLAGDERRDEAASRRAVK